MKTRAFLMSILWSFALQSIYAGTYENPNQLKIVPSRMEYPLLFSKPIGEQPKNKGLIVIKLTLDGEPVEGVVFRIETAKGPVNLAPTNNKGISQWTPIADMKKEEWFKIYIGDQLMEVGVLGPLRQTIAIDLFSSQ